MVKEKKEKPEKKKLESEILREICNYLYWYTNIFFWRANNVPVFGMSGDGKMRFRAMPKFSRKGVPDILAICDGKFIGIEVKQPNGKLSEAQEEFRIKLVIEGGYYMKVTNVVETLEGLGDVLEDKLKIYEQKRDDKRY